MLKKHLFALNLYSKRFISLQTTDGFNWMKQEKLFLNFTKNPEYTRFAREIFATLRYMKEAFHLKHKLLMEPFEYIHKLPCKHHILIKPAFNYWLRVPHETYSNIYEASRTWITWCLLLDDIQDNSQFRYGVPAAHRVFGVGSTINAAGLALLRLQKQIADLGHPSAPKIFEKRIGEVLYGEGIDIYWREKCICPSEEAYIEMTKKKSGAYLMLPFELMQLFSGDKTNYTNLVIDVASYYQMLDDYYNLFHPRALQRLTTNKQQENYMINSDITEGRISLALIHASQFPDVATELIDIFKQRTSDPKLQNRAISLFKKHGSDEYVRDKLKKLEENIRAEIDRLGGNPELTAYMDELCFQNHEQPPDQDLYA